MREGGGRGEIGARALNNFYRNTAFGQRREQEFEACIFVNLTT